MKLDDQHLQNKLTQAVTLQQSGGLKEAMAIYETLLKQFPGHPHILYLYGLALQDAGALKKAMDCISLAITFQPKNGSFHYSLGVILKKLGYLRPALERFKDAFRLEPNNADILFQWGDTHMDLGQSNEAIPYFRQAIDLREAFESAWINLGLCLKSIKQLSKAKDCFLKVIHHNPDSAIGHINLGLTYLLMGEYPAGWHSYEYRFKLEMEPEHRLPIPTNLPQWQGSSLAGKTLLIMSEQGFGDILQFVRFFPQIKAMGARLLFYCPAPLIALMRTLPAIDDIANTPNFPERMDYYCPLLTLPLLLNCQVDSIPNQYPYLYSDPTHSQQWATHLGNPTKFRIGLVWEGKPLHKNDPLRRRSTTLKDLAPLTKVKNVEWYSLQKREPNTESLKPPKGMVITDLQHHLVDFSQTAAVLDHMDLLITIDTAIAHLGGALAKRVWVLLPFAPDWRWLLDQKRTPWYPTLRLFRQSQANCWKKPMEELVDALNTLIQHTLEK